MKISSYDIWDTVIRRKCHPDMIKVKVAQELLTHHYDSVKPHLRDSLTLLRFRQMAERSIGLKNREHGLDDEYHIKEVIFCWLQKIMADDSIDLNELADNICRSEIDLEKDNIYLDPGIIALFESDGSHKRIFISDFYMSGSDIFELLGHLGVAEYFNYGYSSVDFGLNKRSGRLFHKVLSIEGVEPGSIFHCGDNHYSDVEVPGRIGINASIYLPQEEHSMRQKREASFNEMKLGSTYDLQALSYFSENLEPSISLGSIFVNFILSIQGEIFKRNSKHVYFFTREGEFLIQLYDVLRKNSPYRNKLPEAQLLEVSRISTFSPSIHSLSLGEMMRVWNLYSIQTPLALLKTLDLNVDDFSQFFDRFDIDLTSPIKYPWLDERVKLLFEYEPFISAANKVFEIKRSLLVDYCASRGLVSDLQSCVVVDIGWRGTIQDNLSLIFPRVMFHGVYLGLSKFINDQPLNCTKVSSAVDLNASDNEVSRKILDFVAPIEMLTNSNSGSVVGYALEDSGVRARRLNVRDEDVVFDTFTRNFQHKLLAHVNENASIYLDPELDRKDLRSYAVRSWHKLVVSPPPDVVSAYFSLSHNETFGVGSFVPRSQGIGPLWIIKLMLSPSFRRGFKSRINAMGWTDGYLVLVGSPLLKFILRRFYGFK